MSETVIVLQEDSVLIAAGKGGQQPKIERLSRIPVEGYGDPQEQWKIILEENEEQYANKPVTLVLPSGLSAVRVSQIPYAAGKQFTQMAERILSNDFKEETADYAVIHADRKSGITLCCAGAAPDFLEQVVGFCQEHRMLLRRVTVPMEGYLHFLQGRKEYKNKTAVFLFFEESSVTSILCRRGVCHYSSRTIVFSEPGTLDFGTEIVRNLSGILQFYAAEKLEDPITDVYYAGCEAEDFEAAVEGIHDMNLAVAPLPLKSSYGLANGEAFMDLAAVVPFITSRNKNAKLNLLDRMESAKDLGKSAGGVARHFLAPAITLLCCVILTAALSIYNGLVYADNQSVREWILSDSIREAYQRASALERRSADLDRAANQVAQMEQNLSTYPELTRAVISDIVDAGGDDIKVYIQKMDADTGVLEFNAVSEKVIDIPGYVKKLRNTDLFSSVDYSGYTYKEEKYSLTLSCTLAGNSTDDAAEDSTQGGED